MNVRLSKIPQVLKVHRQSTSTEPFSNTVAPRLWTPCNTDTSIQRTVSFVPYKEISLLRTVFFVLCESRTLSLYSTRLTRTSLMRTKETFLAQSSDSHRMSTSLVLTLYSSAVTNLSFLKVKKQH